MGRGGGEDSLIYAALLGKENVCRMASGWTLGRCPFTGSSDKELFSLACSVRDSSIHFVQTPPGGTRLSRLMSTGPLRSVVANSCFVVAVSHSQCLSCDLHWAVTVLILIMHLNYRSPRLTNEHLKTPVIQYLTRN